VELELSSVNVQSSQNLLDISAAVNESTSLANDSAGQQQTTSKKEGNLLSWFTSSSATTSSAINNSPTIAPATSSSPHAFNATDIDQLEDGSSSPNMKISSKLSYGEKFISKFNKNGNKAASSEAPTHEQLTASASGVSKEPQQKSSRRTTSLLNLFMSNSQGKHITVKNAFFKLFSSISHILLFFLSSSILL
jgi:hypothetical protein